MLWAKNQWGCPEMGHLVHIVLQTVKPKNCKLNHENHDETWLSLSLIKHDETWWNMVKHDETLVLGHPTLDKPLLGTSHPELVYLLFRPRDHHMTIKKDLRPLLRRIKQSSIVTHRSKLDMENAWTSWFWIGKSFINAWFEAKVLPKCPTEAQTWDFTQCVRTWHYT